MLKKLRIRFVVINMSIVTVMLCVIFGMVYHFTRQNLEKQSLDLFRMASVTPVAPPRPGSSVPQINLPFFSVRQENGIWVENGDSFYDLSDKQYLQELASAAEAQEDDSGVLPEYGFRYHRSDMPLGRQISFVDISSEQDTLHKLIETCSIIGVLSFAVFLCISIFLARWAVKPVDAAWQQQKQFVADASHELKTPLTVIQASAELLAQTEDPAERIRFTGNITEMVHRMRLLTGELLLLARSDNGQPPQNISSVDFSHTVSAAVLPFEPIFFEAGLILSAQISDGLTLNGDPNSLRQLVDILLDNARKYSTPGGETVLSLQKAGKFAVLSISNPSIPLTPQQCRDVFKRFYRTDPARTGGDGFGLGLSIAEGVVQQHGGKIFARYQDGKFTVQAEFPLLECCQPSRQQ